MKVTFETTECTRCGGSGKYSFNPLDGDRCYGCRGTGSQLTRAGKAAKARFDKAMEEMKVTYADVNEGDKIRQVHGNRKWNTILSVTDDDLNPGRIVVKTYQWTLSTFPSCSVYRWDPKVAEKAANAVSRLKGATITE